MFSKKNYCASSLKERSTSRHAALLRDIILTLSQLLLLHNAVWSAENFMALGKSFFPQITKIGIHTYKWIHTKVNLSIIISSCSFFKPPFFVVDVIVW